jgi:hypothetical protein
MVSVSEPITFLGKARGERDDRIQLVAEDGLAFQRGIKTPTEATFPSNPEERLKIPQLINTTARLSHRTIS